MFGMDMLLVGGKRKLLSFSSRMGSARRTDTVFRGDICLFRLVVYAEEADCFSLLEWHDEPRRCMATMQNDDTMRPTLTYILFDKMGGVFTYVRNLLRYRGASPFATQAILTHNRRDMEEGPADSLPVDREVHFHYDRLENLHAVINRLRRS
jgi:hypothetical protein